MLARRLSTILPAMTLAEAIETTRIQRLAGLSGDCLPSADLAGVASIYAAHVDRQRATTPPGETCPCPYLHLPPHVMAASPNRGDTRNTYG
jgi:predicted ATPase with chaperone activity